MKLRHLLFAATLVASSSSARAELFYTVEQTTDTLCTIDTATGILTQIGALGVNVGFGDLAFDSSTGTMYMSDGWGPVLGQSSKLYTVNLTTGAATLVGAMGTGAMSALVHDPNTNKLYGCAVAWSWGTRGFFEINKSTGQATYLGDPWGDVYGLTHRDATGIIGLSFDRFSSFDETTGANTLLATGGMGSCIAWAPSNDRLYTIDGLGDFYEYDPNNAWSRVRKSSGLPSCDGLALGPQMWPQPTAYCTAGTTSNGCVPSMVWGGSPVVGNTSGFALYVANVEGQRSGILFHGIDNTGFVPSPWTPGSSSWLCVKAPTLRMPAMNSGGTTGQCNGTLSIDWLAFMAANPGALGQPLAAGQTFYGQAWFRDPPAPKSTNLSDALTWVVCP